MNVDGELAANQRERARIKAGLVERPDILQSPVYLNCMFKNIRSLLGVGPKRSETDEQLDEALASATALDHYFFFSNQGDADEAAIGLQERGWTVESVSLDANQQKWLLQVRQLAPIENLNELQTELDLFADNHHGEYDGWQVPGVTEGL
jgi:hypothetical protein